VIFPQGAFTPLVHAHAGRAQVVLVRSGLWPPPDAPVGSPLNKSVKHKMKSEDMDLGKIIDQISAENAGETLEEYWAKRSLFQRVSKESKKYIDTPSSEWPSIKFNWDLSRESQRHSLVGESQKKFEEYYPAGFLLGFVTLQEVAVTKASSGKWVRKIS
jgi:hypothetical protein